MSLKHQDGLLELTFRRDAGGRSVVGTLRQRFPLHTTAPFYIDRADPGMAFVYVQNPTGGVFAGDRLATSVLAGEGSRVHLTTQSATKLYRMNGGEACHELRFEIERGAYVEHVPDSLIPHCGARFHQRVCVEVAPGAAFVATEVLAPGRRARGERFAYDLVDLRAEVHRSDHMLCADVMRLEPSRTDPLQAGVLGGRDYLVTLLAVAPEHDATALTRRLDDVLSAEPTVLGAAGALPHQSGAIVRAIARSALDARQAVLIAWQAARVELTGLSLPEVRK